MPTTRREEVHLKVKMNEGKTRHQSRKLKKKIRISVNEVLSFTDAKEKCLNTAI